MFPWPADPAADPATQMLYEFRIVSALALFAFGFIMWRGGGL